MSGRRFSSSKTFWLALIFATVTCAPLVAEAATSAHAASHGWLRLSGFLALLLALLVIKIGVLGCVLLVATLKPAWVSVGSERVRCHFWLNCLKGALFLAVYLLMGKIAKTLPHSVDHIVLLLMAFLFGVQALIGFTMVSHSLGDRILANLNSPRAGSGFAAVFFGALILLALDVTPIVGQVIGFFVLIAALGVVTTLMTRRDG